MREKTKSSRVSERSTAILAVLLVVSVFASMLSACTKSNAAKELAVANATLPEAVAAPGDNATDEEYSAWQEYNEVREKAAQGNLSAMKPFYKKTLAQFLGEGADNNDRNTLYSPLNVYLALAMLAETTAGNSRQQILDLLGEKDLKALRARVQNLFTANYQDDGVCTSLLANSLWLNKNVSYKQETLDTIAKKHYASTFAGEPGSEEMDKALRAWVNEQTHDLLKDQASELSLDPTTVLALVSTIYYKAAWADQFESSETKKETFYAPSGEVKVDMMHTSETVGYYTGKQFEAVALPLRNSGFMWFFLPAEGASLTDLTTDSQLLKLLTNPNGYKNFSYPQVNLSIPKMDAVSDTDLIPALQELGLTDIFNPAKGNFTPLLTDASDVAVSQVEHAARVKTDEEGVEAAAYTVIAMMKSALPTDFVDFRVDRPYFFAITGYTGDILFAGTINNPQGE